MQASSSKDTASDALGTTVYPDQLLNADSDNSNQLQPSPTLVASSPKAINSCANVPSSQLSSTTIDAHSASTINLLHSVCTVKKEIGPSTPSTSLSSFNPSCLFEDFNFFDEVDHHLVIDDSLVCNASSSSYNGLHSVSPVCYGS